MSPDGDEDNDDVEDALSPEFRQLLSTITREEVDKHVTRCPHLETAERMTKVGPPRRTLHFRLPNLILDRSAHYPRQGSPRFHWWYSDLHYPERPIRFGRARL